jgi:2-phospho-L-lactate transferase/gluconeogenesis factor (CofD/UPF0052 family)
VLEVLYTKRYLAAGPRIVAIGGGTGPLDPAARPEGLLGQHHRIVTVADDGGSSGRLRQQLGIARRGTSATASPPWPTPSR